MRTINKKDFGYVWYVDNGTWLAGPYHKKPPKSYGNGTPVRFKLTPDDGIPLSNTPIKKETKVELTGHTGAMDGRVLWVDTEHGVAKIPVDDKKTRWDLYCKDVKVTMELDV